jgi:hypothetical protein
MNRNPSLSLAGLWQFNPATSYFALVDFYSSIHLGNWAIPIFSLTAPEQTPIAHGIAYQQWA